ncbi:MAG: hypothetical protein AAF378_00595 [Cyanobacteria bacterium P01_A01_bin.84]
MRIQPVRPRSIYKTWLEIEDVANNRAFYILSIILFLMQTINPGNTIVGRIKALLEKYPNVDVFAMGFPEDWESEELWTVDKT